MPLKMGIFIVEARKNAYIILSQPLHKRDHKNSKNKRQFHAYRS